MIRHIDCRCASRCIWRRCVCSVSLAYCAGPEQILLLLLILVVFGETVTVTVTVTVESDVSNSITTCIIKDPGGVLRPEDSRAQALFL